MEWWEAKSRLPREIVEFINTTFELMEVRKKVGEYDSVVFVIHTNEGNHSVPNVHAKYGEFTIEIAIESGEVLAGNLPKKKQKTAMEWVLAHKKELLNDWREIAVSALSNTTKSRIGTCLTDE